MTSRLRITGATILALQLIVGCNSDMSTEVPAALTDSAQSVATVTGAATLPTLAIQTASSTSPRCVAVRSADATELALSLAGCQTDVSQTFEQGPDGSLRVFGTHCLDVGSTRSRNSARAVARLCNERESQQWTTTARGEVVSSAGRCLTNGGPSTLTVERCDRGGNQRWTLRPLTVVPAPPTATPLALNVDSLRLGAIDETGQLSVVGSDAPAAAVTWISRSPDVATVSATGLVTARAAGSTQVVATSANGADSATVIVSPPTTTPATPTVAISVDALTLTSLGETGQLTAVASGADVASITWTSLAPSVATVSAAGLVSARAVGTALIVASIAGASDTAQVRVTQTIASISVGASTMALTVPQTRQLTAVARDAQGNTIGDAPVTWSSSASAVAGTSSAGLVTALQAGTATISARSATGVQGSTVVTVSAATPVSGQVTLYPGNNIQTAVNNNPAGTVFVLTPGTYTGQQIVPKSGNVFYGQPGAVLDGEDTRTSAFRVGNQPYPENVRIHGLKITRYKPAPTWGAVQAGNSGRSDGARGWMIDSNEVSYNATVGIQPGIGTRVIGNNVHHNGQLGIGGAPDGALVEGNEISWNNYAKTFDFGWEAGGLKIALGKDNVVRGNYVHDNWGPGIWYDIDMTGSLIENNRVENNADAGIFYEISHNAIIRGNTVTGNGFANAKWLYGAGIFISASTNVEVYDNTVTGNARGITAVMQDRGTGFYGLRELRDLNVHDNRISMIDAGPCFSGGCNQSGLGQDVGSTAYFTSKGNRFVRNTYTLGSTTGNWFTWNDDDVTPAQWRALGQDANGTFTIIPR